LLSRWFFVKYTMSLPELSHVTFGDPRRAERSFLGLHEQMLAAGSTFSPADLTSALVKHLPDAPDPELALAGLLRFTEATLSRAGLFNDLLQHSVLMDMMVRVLGDSAFFTDILVRDPSLFRWLTATGVLNRTDVADDLREDVRHMAEAFPRSERHLDALRRMLRREVLRIGVQDVLGLADLRTVTGELSEVADIMIDAVLGVALKQMKLKYGVVPDETFAVIGLGKLGGQELNYSSDVDLLFVYGADGNTPRLSCSHHEFFVELAERLVQNLTQPSSEGHMYRVDMRLRPEAGAGSLARSLPDYLLYYESRGELWERQMLLKARTVAGSQELGKRFLNALEPFVYPRTFMEHPVESIARIKGRIEANIGDAANVKLMAGGIRDIEFTVQALQLVNGGRNRSIRTGNTLEAIAALRSASLLGEEEARSLADAYVFLRTVEHRLQTMHNTQVHTIPADPPSRSTLARRVGLSGGEKLIKEIDRHRAQVRAVFDSVMRLPENMQRSDVSALLDGLLPEAQARKLLEKYGFREMRQATRDLRVLSGGSGLMNAEDTESRTRSGFRKMAEGVLDSVAATPDPDLTLHSLAIIAEAQAAPTAFHAQLADQRFRKLLIDISSFGVRFARMLAANPPLLDAIASDVSLVTSTTPLSLPSAPTLPQLKQQRELQACLRHLLGFSEYDEMTRDICDIAEFILKTIVEGRNDGPPFAVFAAGKLGTREATIDADLDLLFVAEATRSRDLAAAERRAGQIVAQLTAATPAGRLYETDLRLRPEGRNAPLVVDLKRYRDYLRSRASLWERQMLTRLRYVCGSRQVGDNVTGMMSELVFMPPLPQGWLQAIVEMRRKMEPRTRTRGPEIIDLKRGPGGMADIEFLVQMWLLHRRSDPPQDRTVRALLAAASPGLLTEAEAELAGKAYTIFRRLELLMRVTLEERSAILPEGPRLETLARRFGRKDGRELTAEVVRTMRQVRTGFLAVTDRLMKGEQE
jgi:[glutamine synthetase] adenylyltransferase / [glutamine synthetase]-adenylyl-L-tyrosine phosphorylase